MLKKGIFHPSSNKVAERIQKCKRKIHLLGIFITTKQVLRSGSAYNNKSMDDKTEEESIPKLFGNNVRKFRKKAGLTQEQLSEQLKISQKHLSIIETGTQFASASLIARLAKALHVQPAMLFGGYPHEVNYDEVNATALLLEDFIRKQMAVVHTRLDRLESLIAGGENGRHPSPEPPFMHPL